MQIFYIIWVLLFSTNVSTVEEAKNARKDHIVAMVKKVNKLRKNGCYCAGKRMKPVGPIFWNETLYKSALSHAKEMSDYDFFAHYSKDGKDIGQRIEAFGYRWQVVGENLGEGQKNFDEVLHDWLDSPSHCEMLMNPKVNEMGVANYGKFWVQHFAKKIPTRASPK